MEYTFLMKQHIGAPSVGIVSANDKVKRGQMIAKKPDGAPLGGNIFSSVDGTVRSVSAEKIVIEAQETDFSKYVPLAGESAEELLEASGLVGLGGAGFPTYFKLKTRFDGASGCVIANAAECEPILSHNIARIEEEARNLIEGLRIAMKIANAGRGIVAIKGRREKAIAKLKEAAAGCENISVSYLENIYPVGEERAIVRDTLDILLEPEQLPSAADAVVINAETLFRLREAVCEKKPLMDKDMTVAGKLKENASIHIFRDVPLGSTVASVIEKAGGIGSEYGELIMGGPFTGKRCEMTDPVIKTTGGIIAAENFLPGPERIGLLVCACGADKERLAQQAASMGSSVVGVEYCKQAKEVKGARKCENPGHCPGQVQKVLALKKAGAQALLISNCTDCTNTVMSCAPQLQLPVYHCTDGAMRSVNYKMIRKIKTN